MTRTAKIAGLLTVSVVIWALGLGQIVGFILVGLWMAFYTWREWRDEQPESRRYRRAADWPPRDFTPPRKGNP